MAIDRIHDLLEGLPAGRRRVFRKYLTEQKDGEEGSKECDHDTPEDGGKPTPAS